MYEYKKLKNEKIINIVNCINESFIDYELDMVFTVEALETRFKLAGVNLGESYGVYYNENLVGTLLIVQQVDENKTDHFLFNASIIAEHRSKGLFKKLFSLYQENNNNNLKDFYSVEVLENNLQAIHSYQSVGFEITNKLMFFKGNIDLKLPLEGVKLETVDLRKLKHLYHSYFSFENSIKTVNMNLSAYEMISYYDLDIIVSSIIINKQNGKIVQIYRSSEEDLLGIKEIINYTSNKYYNLFITNLDSNDQMLVDLFVDLKFNNFINQYQMEIK